MPNRPPRLHWVFQKYDPPLYFVTFNTYKRRKLLANARVHSSLIEFAKVGEQRGTALGRYVIMPDHVHLFVRGGIDFVLAQWTRMLKRRLSEAISAPLPHWQKGFFDHLIRQSESYSEKWEYVREILSALDWSMILTSGLGKARSQGSRRCSGACVKHRTENSGARSCERLCNYLRAELFGFGLAACADSRRKIVSPSFIRSRRSRATVSR